MDALCPRTWLSADPVRFNSCMLLSLSSKSFPGNYRLLCTTFLIIQQTGLAPHTNTTNAINFTREVSVVIRHFRTSPKAYTRLSDAVRSSGNSKSSGRDANTTLPLRIGVCPVKGQSVSQLLSHFVSQVVSQSIRVRQFVCQLISQSIRQLVGYLVKSLVSYLVSHWLVIVNL